MFCYRWSWPRAYLQTSATWLAGSLRGASGVEYSSPLKGALKAAAVPLHGIAETVFGDSAQLQGVLISLLSAALIVAALLTLVRTLRSAMQRKAEKLVEEHAWP